MFNPIDIVLFLLGFCVLPLCLLIYGLFVIGFYVRHAKKRKTHLRSYCFLVGFLLVVWAYYYSRPSETRIGEEVNSVRTGSVVELCDTSGWRGSDVYLYVRDYAVSGKKLIPLKFSYPTETDNDWTPVLYWSKNGSLLVIQVNGKPEITAYDFKAHKIVRSSTSEILRKSQGPHNKTIVLDTLTQHGRSMRNWERVVWGSGFP